MQKKELALINFTQICLSILTFVLLFALPQINVSGYVQTTITSKLIYFLYGCSALSAFYIFYIISAKTTSFSFSKLDLSLFLLLIYIILNRYIIQPDFGFSILYIELIGLSFLYVILRSLSSKSYPWLLLAIVISGIFQAVYGNLQLLGYYGSNHSGFKMTGSFFNPGPYAGFLVSVWPITMGMYLFKDKIISQVQSQTKSDSLFLNKFIKQAFEYIPLLGLTTIAIVLPSTLSRATWIAAITCSIVLIELKYSKLKGLFEKINTLKKTILIVLFSGILSAGLFGAYYFKKGSTDGRAFIWKVTTEMIADNPVFGVGIDRFKAHYMNYQAHYFAKNGETSEVMIAANSYYAFNDWLQFVAENGMLGFIFLMIAVLVLFKTKVSTAHQYIAPIAKTSFISIGIFASFSYPSQILPIKIVLVFLLATLSKSTATPYVLKTEENKMRLWPLKTVIVLLFYFCINKNISYTKSLDHGFIIWENALRKHQYGDYKGALTAYASVYSTFKKDGDFLMNYGKTLAMEGQSHKAIAILERSKSFLNTSIIATALGDSYKATHRYDKAEVAYQGAINMVPNQFYPNYLLAKLYDDSGQDRKATAMAEKILEKEIKIPSTAINEIRTAMKNILIKYKNPLGFKN